MMTKINIRVGEKIFAATLSDSAATQSLLAQLPLTVAMLELNGNEKYVNLTTKLPTDPRQVGSIEAGDLMLYGSDCLVLFYKSFTTSYRYTKLGQIEDTSGLADVLGSRHTRVILSAA